MDERRGGDRTHAILRLRLVSRYSSVHLETECAKAGRDRERARESQADSASSARPSNIETSLISKEPSRTRRQNEAAVFWIKGKRTRLPRACLVTAPCLDKPSHGSAVSFYDRCCCGWCPSGLGFPSCSELSSQPPRGLLPAATSTVSYQSALGLLQLLPPVRAESWASPGAYDTRALKGPPPLQIAEDATIRTFAVRKACAGREAPGVGPDCLLPVPIRLAGWLWDSPSHLSRSQEQK